MSDDERSRFERQLWAAYRLILSWPKHESQQSANLITENGGTLIGAISITPSSGSMCLDKPCEV